MSSYYFSNFEAIALCSAGAVVFGLAIGGCAVGTVELVTRQASTVAEVGSDFQTCSSGDRLVLLHGRMAAEAVVEKLGSDSICALDGNLFEKE